jgi:hypothetical protein
MREDSLEAAAVRAWLGGMEGVGLFGGDGGGWVG